MYVLDIKLLENTQGLWCFYNTDAHLWWSVTLKVFASPIFCTRIFASSVLVTNSALDVEHFPATPMGKSSENILVLLSLSITLSRTSAQDVLGKAMYAISAGVDESRWEAEYTMGRGVNMTLCKDKCEAGCSEYLLPGMSSMSVSHAHVHFINSRARWHYTSVRYSYLSLHKPGKGKCFNPQHLFPADQQWGNFDVRDVCNRTHVRRSFYKSSNATCTYQTGVYADVYQFFPFTCLKAMLAQQTRTCIQCAHLSLLHILTCVFAFRIPVWLVCCSSVCLCACLLVCIQSCMLVCIDWYRHVLLCMWKRLHTHVWSTRVRCTNSASMRVHAHSARTHTRTRRCKVSSFLLCSDPFSDQHSHGSCFQCKIPPTIHEFNPHFWLWVKIWPKSNNGNFWRIYMCI